ncbi:MAG: nitrite reductase large subunit NirB, partial [Tepidisphaeraceae bacterium]
MLLHDRKKLVVIGNGMAGARVVEEILERSRLMFDVTMIGAERYGNYNRILLSSILNGSQDPDSIFINPLDWYEKNDVRLLSGVRAFTVDRAFKQVLLADGGAVPFDKLIIATDSRAFIPPIPGTDLQGVFAFRTLDDCTRIAEYARGAKVAAVIGGGLLGLEAARGLMTHGPAVHVIDTNDYLMSVQLDRPAGDVLGKAIDSLGVTAHCGKKTVGILNTPYGRVRGLEFDDGTVLHCDMVVISAGIRANIEIAKNCAIPCERGILVNDQMQAAVGPDIYAIGECAQHAGKVYGLVAPIFEQCTVLADHITEKDPQAAYSGSILATKLKVMGVNVAGMGERDEQAGDEVVRYEDAATGIYKKLIVRDGRLVGAILVGEIDTYGALLGKLQSGQPLPARRSELLFGAPAAEEVSLADLPDDHQICDCNGVPKRSIVNAIKEGHCTVAAVGKCTRAGTGCGSCRKLVKGLIEAVAGEVKVDPSETWYVPGIPMEKPALAAEIRRRGLKSVSAVMAALATKEDEKSKMGLAILVRAIWNKEYIDERDCRFVNDRLHGNIQKDGTFSVIPRIYGGVTSADELIKIGQVAKKYNVPTVKLTGGQRIDLLGVKKEELPAVWRDLGMTCGYAYTKAFRTCKTCVGSEFCRYGTNDSTALGIAIERRFQGFEFPAKVKMAVSGCPRNCAESTVKDLG